MHSCKSLAGRLESHQRGFWIETLLLCPGDLLSKSSKLTFSRKRWWGGQPPVNVRRVGGKHNTVKQADSGFLGWMLRKFQGEPLKPDHALAFCQASFLMTFATGGIPHAGSQHLELRNLVVYFLAGCVLSILGGHPLVLSHVALSVGSLKRGHLLSSRPVGSPL